MQPDVSKHNRCSPLSIHITTMSFLTAIHIVTNGTGKTPKQKKKLKTLCLPIKNKPMMNGYQKTRETDPMVIKTVPKVHSLVILKTSNNRFQYVVSRSQFRYFSKTKIQSDDNQPPAIKSQK
jgi:hypothetical protein